MRFFSWLLDLLSAPWRDKTCGVCGKYTEVRGDLRQVDPNQVCWGHYEDDDDA